MFSRWRLPLQRHVGTMTSKKIPQRPLVVILGSTGTGKSELAVELALRFRGEIINTDAMQLYDGLPVITNKITLEEQRSIPHHLLGNISIEKTPWDVDDFKREALQTIQDIRSRGNMPILVGGTQYYVDPLLFREVVLDIETKLDTKKHPILNASTEEMWEELKRVDPVMANRWHPNDRRKIERSLLIYLSTGKRASDLYEEQTLRKSQAAEKEPWENLLFWICAEKETLNTRLDDRVDAMLEAGLLEEVEELRRFKIDQAKEGNILSMTKGIWQSIGYKQLEPYLVAKEEGQDGRDLDKLKTQGLEQMKVATRQYAKYQNRWTRTKQIPLLKEHGAEAVKSFYVLDSTDVSAYPTNVVEKAAELTRRFLEGQDRQHPNEVSDFARATLEGATVESEQNDDVPCRQTCDICGTVTVTERMWTQHIQGSAHRRRVKKKQKLALAPVPPTQLLEKQMPTSPNLEDIEADVGALFGEEDKR